MRASSPGRYLLLGGLLALQAFWRARYRGRGGVVSGMATAPQTACERGCECTRSKSQSGPYPEYAGSPAFDTVWMKAGNETRTRDIQLGKCSRITRHRSQGVDPSTSLPMLSSSGLVVRPSVFSLRTQNQPVLLGPLAAPHLGVRILRSVSRRGFDPGWMKVGRGTQAVCILLGRSSPEASRAIWR